MLGLLAAGSVFFPGLFLASKGTLTRLMGWSEADAVVISTRLVSSLQAIMASSSGWIIVSSCRDVMEDRHWLAEAYILFATPYFAYDVVAMFLCYWYRLQVKGREEAGPGGGSLRAAASGFLRREALLVLHHVFMVAFCFPASLVTMATPRSLWRHLQDRREGAVNPGTSRTRTRVQNQGPEPEPKRSQIRSTTRTVPNQSPSEPSSGTVTTAPPVCCCRYASIPLYRVPLVAPWQCNLGAALLWPLQLYWFSLICRGALRRSRRRPTADGPPPAAPGRWGGAEGGGDGGPGPRGQRGPQTGAGVGRRGGARAPAPEEPGRSHLT
ncbi:ceramide synthase-like [Anableps anableps]